MRRSVSLFAALVAMPCLFGGELILAERGKRADFAIVVREGAGPSEAFAATEFRDWTAKLTGVTLPVVTNAHPAKAVRMRTVSDSRLGDDGFRLRTDGDDLRIEGGVRGVLYGVYEILERFGGIGWFASYSTLVPEVDRLAVPDGLDETHVPAFEMREEYFYDVSTDGDFAARLRLNGNFCDLKERHGGKFGRVGAGLRSHTFWELLRVEEYGRTHPEYFSMRGGKRVVSDDPKHETQLCLTNPDVVRIVADNLIAAIRRDPTALRFGVSQNDNVIHCECEACAAVDTEEGGHAGTVVRFVNAVAARVKEVFPDKFVQAAAYQYSRRPVKSSYADNVLLELCPLECDCAHPIATGRFGENVDFREDLAGWSKKTPRLFIWNYVTDFNCFPMPFPNLRTLPCDVRYFRDCGVKWMSPEGPYQGRGADLQELKGWLLAKLMWNPDLDFEAHLNRFLDGFYGAAAPFVRDYIAELDRLVGEDGKVKLSCFEDPLSKRTVTDEFLVRARKLWDGAEAAVKDDSMRLKAVRLSALGADYVRFLRLDAKFKPPRFTVRRTAPDASEFGTERREVARRIAGLMADEPNLAFKECWGKAREEVRKAVLDAAAGKLQSARDFHPSDRVSFEAEDVVVSDGNGAWCRTADDPSAAGGRAVRFSNAAFEWCIQLPMPKVSFDADAEYAVRVKAKVARKPGADGNAVAFSYGISDRGEHKASVSRTVRVRDVADGGWRWYELPFRPGELLAFWFASGRFDRKAHREHPSIEAVTVDQVEIVRRDAVTAGWENVCPERREYEPAAMVWCANPADPGNFVWELRDGAEGSVEISARGIRVRKTNSDGYVLVTAKPFAVRKGQGIRFLADQEVPDADVEYSSGVLRAFGRTENLALDRRAERRNFFVGGLQTMRGQPCTAPGMTYRKYGQCFAADDTLTPAIVVSGAPSDSVWRDWRAEDLEASERAWKEETAKLPTPEYRGNRMDEAEFDRLLAADRDHTAVVERRDGVSRLVVDGGIAAPVAYCARQWPWYDFANDRGEMFAGKPLDGGALKIMVKAVVPYRRLKPDGTLDAKACVREIRNAMRLAPHALFVIGVSGGIPKDFIAKDHPEEAWIDETGKPVYGTFGSCVVGYLDHTEEAFRKGAFPWPSMSSRVWREWVKARIRELVAELKAQGLSKRVVGIHTFGFHDLQYSVARADRSKPAMEEYRRMLAEPDCLSTNYAFCMKQTAFRAQEEFVREFKRALGKPALGVMWCESPLQGAANASLDLTSFVRSDEMDVIVCQPDYRERLPAFPSVSAIPTDSLHLHGKLYWAEYDIRTYAPIEGRGHGSPVSAMSVGMAADFPMWRTMVRKLAGEADATRMGYWLYDIKAGWFSPPEIAADIRDLAAGEELLARRTPSPWRPDVAVVVDETQVLPEGEDPLPRIPYTDDFIYARQSRHFATSGVPHERYLAEDVLRDPSLLDGRKLVVLAFFRKIDGRRAALIRRLAGRGVSLLFLSETGVRGGAGATGFRVSFAEGSHNHRIVPARGVRENVMSEVDAAFMREENRSVDHGPRCTVAEEPGVEVLARYAQDGKPAVAVRADPDCRRIYVCDPGGLTPALMNRFAREAGAYVAVDRTGLQVNMNGDFVSIHCLRPGKYDFRLPFDCRIVNLRSGVDEPVSNGILKLNLTAGETCRFELIARTGK